MASTDYKKAIARHVLLGESVIDTQTLFFDSKHTVDQFLRINGFEWAVDQDRQCLMSIHNEAISYTEALIEQKVDRCLASPDDLRDIFLIAAEAKGSKPIQISQFPPVQEMPSPNQACLLLKIMNIIHHINGHELLYGCSISRRHLAQKVDDKIGRELSRLKANGFPIISFGGGRKPKESLITKLLCKPSALASDINTWLRYKIVVREKIDLLNLIIELFSQILPFNYIFPQATVNQLVDPKLIMNEGEIKTHKTRDIAQAIARSVNHILPHPPNEMDFTGVSYKVVKFCVDVPVTLDAYVTRLSDVYTRELGKIVFSPVEITMIDQATMQSNEEGENKHSRYKMRQKRGAFKRMICGRLS